MKAYAIFLLMAAGLLAGCSRSIQTVSQQFNALPAQVQRSVRAQAPDAEIIGISQRTQSGTPVYEIEFRQGGNHPRMMVAADGRVISSELPDQPAGVLRKLLTPTGAVGTQWSALPEKVQATIEANAPHAPVAGITRRQEDGRTIYDVQFQEPDKNPTLRVAEDGTLVQALQK